MDWTQVLTVLGVNGLLFFWARSEAREDHRLMLGIIDSIRQEIKDFHGRLCAIEERNHDKRGD